MIRITFNIFFLAKQNLRKQVSKVLQKRKRKSFFFFDLCSPLSPFHSLFKESDLHPSLEVQLEPDPEVLWLLLFSEDVLEPNIS